MAVPKEALEQIVIPAERSEGYRQWIRDGSDALKAALPFKGKADIAITLGSGLGPIVNHLSPTFRVKIPYANVGLPIGQVEGHEKEIIGAKIGGKNVILVNGRTHAYEIPEEGIKTETWGNLSRMELATGYLAMLNQVGVDNMVLMSAAGGINHPMLSDQPKPFNKERLPIIGLIASDLNLAYSNPQMGPYVGFANKRFVNLKDADPELMAKFRQSMAAAGENVVRDLDYITSPSTPSFEDRRVVYHAAFNRGEVVGMTFSYEKEYLSGVDGIPRFIGIAVVTNPQELVDQFSEEAISLANIGNYRPHRLELAALANHEEVQEYGAKAVDVLGKALTHLIKSV